MRDVSVWELSYADRVRDKHALAPLDHVGRPTLV
jgi:hypothetical protein